MRIRKTRNLCFNGIGTVTKKPVILMRLGFDCGIPPPLRICFRFLSTRFKPDCQTTSQQRPPPLSGPKSNPWRRLSREENRTTGTTGALGQSSKTDTLTTGCSASSTIQNWRVNTCADRYYAHGTRLTHDQFRDRCRC